METEAGRSPRRQFHAAIRAFRLTPLVLIHHYSVSLLFYGVVAAAAAVVSDSTCYVARAMMYASDRPPSWIY